MWTFRVVMVTVMTSRYARQKNCQDIHRLPTCSEILPCNLSSFQKVYGIQTPFDLFSQQNYAANDDAKPTVGQFRFVRHPNIAHEEFNVRKRDGNRFHGGISDTNKTVRWFLQSRLLVLDDLINEWSREKCVLDGDLLVS